MSGLGADDVESSTQKSVYTACVLGVGELSSRICGSRGFRIKALSHQVRGSFPERLIVEQRKPYCAATRILLVLYLHRRYYVPIKQYCYLLPKLA